MALEGGLWKQQHQRHCEYGGRNHTFRCYSRPLIRNSGGGAINLCFNNPSGVCFWCRLQFENHWPEVHGFLPEANTQDPTYDKAIREKTWWARQIRFSGVSKRSAHETLPLTRPWERKPDRQGRSGFQGFRKAAPGTHLKDDLCLSDVCVNGLLPDFSDTGRKAFPNLFPNKNQFRTLINKFPRWWYFMRLSRVKGVF